MTKRWLNINECAEHIGVSIHTVYQYVSKRSIPFSKVPNSNLIRFDRDRIDQWLESGTVLTAAEALKGGEA